MVPWAAPAAESAAATTTPVWTMDRIFRGSSSQFPPVVAATERKPRVQGGRPDAERLRGPLQVGGRGGKGAAGERVGGEGGEPEGGVEGWGVQDGDDRAEDRLPGYRVVGRHVGEDGRADEVVGSEGR